MSEKISLDSSAVNCVFNVYLFHFSPLPILELYQDFM